MKKLEARSVNPLKMAGPALLVVGTGVGAGDIVSATVGGSNFGLVLLWAVVCGAFFKFVLIEGIARWQLATGQSVLEGWANFLPPWVKAYFGLYLVFWSFAVSAALASACGLGFENLTGGAVTARTGAVLHSVAGFFVVWFGGFNVFAKVMKAFVGVMFASVIICAGLIADDLMGTVRGLAIPTIPAGGGVYVLSVLGGIGGSITLMSYNYWMREEKLIGPSHLKYVRADLAIAYGLTALFVISVMIIANQAFHVSGTELTDSQAVERMAEMLGGILGPSGLYIYRIGFWAAVFTSLLGVWQGVPYIFADYYGILKRYPESVRKEITRVTSVSYRMALVFISFIPIPFIFMGRPLFLIVAYTIIGSLFIPFLAATLFYLNNRVDWSAPIGKNKSSTNVVLLAALALFAVLAVLEVMEVLG